MLCFARSTHVALPIDAQPHVSVSVAAPNPTQPSRLSAPQRVVRTVGYCGGTVGYCGVPAYCSATGTGRRRNRAVISGVQADVGYLDSVLQHGGIKAAEVAHTSMQRVLQLTGLRAS